MQHRKNITLLLVASYHVISESPTLLIFFLSCHLLQALIRKWAPVAIVLGVVFLLFWVRKKIWWFHFLNSTLASGYLRTAICKRPIVFPIVAQPIWNGLHPHIITSMMCRAAQVFWRGFWQEVVSVDMTRCLLHFYKEENKLLKV